jgi:hypothetical protein
MVDIYGMMVVEEKNLTLSGERYDESDDCKNRVTEISQW